MELASRVPVPVNRQMTMMLAVASMPLSRPNPNRRRRGAPAPGRGGVRNVRYLLDGHHKLAAYEAEPVRLLLIELTPQEPAPLPRNTLGDC